jgi:hypothetical protein
MTFSEQTTSDLENSGLDWNSPELGYEKFASVHRGSAGWHIERCRVLYNTFHLKLFGLCRAPRKNQVSINKKPWLQANFASSIREGLLEQIVAEEAIRIYQELNPVSLSQTESMRVILDEYPAAAAAASASSELVDSAKELGAQAGYMVDLWNRAVATDPLILEPIGVQDIAKQRRRVAVVSFITFFRVTGEILAKEGMRYLNVQEYKQLIEEYVTED